MIVLALDTALDRTAVALSDGRRLAVSQAEAMERGHAERLMPMVAAVMAEAGLPLSAIDRIAATVGPGSFTGIRIAVAAARGLALALGRPAVGVGTLEALAASVAFKPDGPVLAAVDARRGEIYAALYSRDGAEILAPFAATAADVLAAVADRAAVIVGSGAPILAHEARILGQRVPSLEPLAGPDPLVVAALAARLPADAPAPVPFYIRPPDAKPQPAMAGLR